MDINIFSLDFQWQNKAFLFTWENKKNTRLSFHYYLLSVDMFCLIINKES